MDYRQKSTYIQGRGINRVYGKIMINITKCALELENLNAQVISNLRSRQWGRNGAAGSSAFRSFNFTTVKCATPVDGIYLAGGFYLTTDEIVKLANILIEKNYIIYIVKNRLLFIIT